MVVTYGNMDSQMKGMIEAWGWTVNDVILHVLPLHHVHGVVNVLMTALYCGATCKMLPKFDAKEVIHRNLIISQLIIMHLINMIDHQNVVSNKNVLIATYIAEFCEGANLSTYFLKIFFLKVSGMDLCILVFGYSHYCK